MITLVEGTQSLTERVVDLTVSGGTGAELKITKTFILKDTSSDLQSYATVSGLTKQELTTTALKTSGKIGLNSQQILGSSFTYNRIYYLNAADEEIVRLKINEVSETNINIDVIVELGDSSTVTIVNA